METQLLCLNNQESLVEAFREEYELQLRNNTFPKCVIAFKNLFNKDNQMRREKIVSPSKTFQELEIAPNKVLKVGISNSFEYIQEIAKFMKEFAGIRS